MFRMNCFQLVVVELDSIYAFCQKLHFGKHQPDLLHEVDVLNQKIHGKYYHLPCGCHVGRGMQ